MDIRNITRTSAIIYADEMAQRTTDTIRRKFVEAIFVNNNNSLMSIAEIANAIEDELSLTFADEEIKHIVKDSEYFVEVLGVPRDNIKYNLVEKRYQTLSGRSSQSINETIERYIETGAELTVSKDDFKDIINRYLYMLLNTNISSYQHVINPTEGKFKDICNYSFSDEEIDIINQFLKWDDENKNKDLFKLISYCVEYAVIVNNSSEQVLTKSLRNKIFYLDNALIYRALGINGEVRKRRALSFIKKCKENGQKLMVSKFTKQEFEDTIDYHLSLLNRSTPFGRISPNAFKQYARGEGFYQFYHSWRNGRLSYGFDMFKNYILGQYKNLLSTYDIEEDYKVPFDEKEDTDTAQKYADEIQAIKKTNREQLHYTDALNMYWIEVARNNNNVSISDTKYYFVTSDQKLQIWDNNHSVNQPITLLPSQWLGLLLKYVSRTSDDFKSFVSFLNIPRNESLIDPDNLQTIMAGISEITEDFIRQEIILEDMVAIKFEGIINEHTQLNAKAFAKEKVEQEFERKLEAKEQERLEQQALNEQLISQIKQESVQILNKYMTDAKMEKLQNISREIDRYQRIKATIDRKVNTRYSIYKSAICLCELILIIGWIVLIVKVGWDKMEMWTYFMGIPLWAVPTFFMCISGKSINIMKYAKLKAVDYRMTLNEQFEYSPEELKELFLMRQQLEDEVGIKRQS